MMPTYLITSLLLLASVGAKTASKTVEWRLPTIIRPSTYEINLHLTNDSLMGNNQYEGTVAINIMASEATDTIKLHASHEYLSLNLVTVAGVVINETNYTVDTTTDMLTIKLNTLLQPNVTTRLFINFTGIINTTDYRGFYISTYVTDDLEARYLATTQFEPTYARRAFPNFDEPFFKAAFKIDITHPLGYNALSNSPGTAVKSENGVSQTTQFKQTTKMSTYLVAFVISDFNCTRGANIRKVPYQVCSTPKSTKTREWAVEIGPPILESFNEYTQLDYGFYKSKLDQVAIPDFEQGAMENWGLVIYKEQALLWDPNECILDDKMNVATTIAHEMAHAWFGNLVTCNWWSEIFLTEGMAFYFQAYQVHDVLPSWEQDKQYILSVQEAPLRYDVYYNNKPLQLDVNTPEEIYKMFGFIAYNKGGAVFRMAAHIIGGPTQFQNGLRNYLKKYQYMNTLPEDLWSSLQGAMDNSTAKLPASSLAEVMNNWVKLVGYPLLTVRVNGTYIEITQERLLFSGRDKTSKWFVPISYTTSEDTNKFTNTSPMCWLTPTTNNVSFHIGTKVKWLLLNNQQTGYYRVNYDTNTWNNIKVALNSENFGGIADTARAQIVDDLFNLVLDDKIQYSEIFNIIKFLRNDTSYFPWKSASDGLTHLLGRFKASEKLNTALSAFYLFLLESLYNSVSFTADKEEDHIYTLKQVLAITQACTLDDPRCIAESATLFNKFRDTGVRPPKNLRRIVYCTALRTSQDPDDLTFMLDEFSNAKDMEKVELGIVLPCSPSFPGFDQRFSDSMNLIHGISNKRTFGSQSMKQGKFAQSPELIAEIIKADQRWRKKHYSNIYNYFYPDKVQDQDTTTVRAKAKIPTFDSYLLSFLLFFTISF